MDAPIDLIYLFRKIFDTTKFHTMLKTKRLPQIYYMDPLEEKCAGVTLLKGFMENMHSFNPRLTLSIQPLMCGPPDRRHPW